MATKATTADLNTSTAKTTEVKEAPAKTTAEEVADKNDIELTEENILEPDVNINIGTKYISILLERYECVEVALAAYNAGIGNVDKWIENGTIKADGSDIENIPFKETNNYVRKIMRDYKIYSEK